MADKQLQTWIARLTKELDKQADDRTRECIGRDAGGGFVIVATDGARALLMRGPATKPGEPLTSLLKAQRSTELDYSKALIDALKRMRAANSDRKRGWLALTVDPDARTLTLATHDSNDLTEAREWLPIRGELAAVRVAVNIGYLQSMLSLPGVQLFPGDGSGPMTAAPPCDTYRLVLMPIAKAQILDIERTQDEQTVAA